MTNDLENKLIELEMLCGIRDPQKQVAKLFALENTVLKLIKALRVANEFIGQIAECRCEKAYSKRNRIDPSCVYCNLCVESYKGEIQQIMCGGNGE